MYGMPYDNYMGSPPPPPPHMGLPPPPHFYMRYDYANQMANNNGNGPTIVELEASELGGTMNGSYNGGTTRSEMSFRRENSRQQYGGPVDGSPRSLGRAGRVYNRRLGSRTYLVDEGSDIAANKIEPQKTRPWKEVNDDVSARMVAASSDSPPLIPKKDYDDSPLPLGRSHSKQPMMQLPQAPSSLHQSESGSDEGKEMDPLNGNNQLTLYRGPPRHPFDPFGMGMPSNGMEPIYAFGRMPPMPPPGGPFCGMPPMMPPPHMMPQDQCFPPPPPEMFPPFFPPPPPMPFMDYEMFTYDEKRRKNKSKKLRKYRSLECISFPPPPPPHMFFPPPHMGMLPPPPPSFVMHPPPPPPDSMMGPIGPPHFFMTPPPMFDCGQGGPPPPPPQLALPPVPPAGNGNPANQQLIPYQQLTNPNLRYDSSNQKMPINDYNSMKGVPNGTMKSKKDAESGSLQKKPNGICSHCCKGTSLVLWLVIGIILVGLVAGLVLGLTLVP